MQVIRIMLELGGMLGGVHVPVGPWAICGWLQIINAVWQCGITFCAGLPHCACSACEVVSMDVLIMYLFAFTYKINFCEVHK